jgi:hypothetical protein
MPRGIEPRQLELDSVIAKYLTPPPIGSIASKKPDGNVAISVPEYVDRAIVYQRRSKRVAELFRGEWEGRYTSHSEADFALTSELHKILDGDPCRVDRIFRQSALYRTKWERDSYRNPTLERAARDSGSLGGRGGFSIHDLPSVWGLDAKIEWAVDRIVARRAITMITGDSAAGKSTFAMAMSGAVAHGQKFLGRAVIQMPVLYVDRENSLATVRERLDRLKVAETPQFKCWGGWCDPQPDGPAAATIQKYVRECEPLVIFDSIIAFHEGSEQDASETRRFMTAFRALANLGATVLLIHHTGKATTSKEYRGSSDLKAAVDVAWLLEPQDGTSKLGRARLVPFKNRLGTSEPLTIEYTDDGYTIDRSARTTGEVVVKIVRDRPGIGQPDLIEIARTRGCTRDAVRNFLANAKREGVLCVQASGKGGKQSYSLPNEVE